MSVHRGIFVNYNGPAVTDDLFPVVSIIVGEVWASPWRSMKGSGYIQLKDYQMLIAKVHKGSLKLSCVLLVIFFKKKGY